MAISTSARYEVASAGTHTPEELAHHWMAELKVATDAATPAGASDQTAYWAGMPLATGNVVAHAYGTQAQTTIPDDGTVHIVVSAGADKTTTAVVAATADAIDKAVMGSCTLDGAIVATDALTFSNHAAEDGPVDLFQKAIAVDGFAYALLDTEVVKVTNITTHLWTVVRGACGSTAATHIDDTAIYWYCGADNTVVGVDDETVWGTIAAHTAAGGRLVVMCGTEQMLVTGLIPGAIPDTIKVTRGYDGTTAAVHADNAAVTQYIDEGTAIFNVDNGALLVDECLYKTGTAGTEVWKVKTIATHRITVTRGAYNTVPTVMADGQIPFRLWGPEIYDAALTAVNAIANVTFSEGRYGACNVHLGLNPQHVAWSTESQPEEA